MRLIISTIRSSCEQSCRERGVRCVRSSAGCSTAAMLWEQSGQSQESISAGATCHRVPPRADEGQPGAMREVRGNTPRTHIPPPHPHILSGLEFVLLVGACPKSSSSASREAPHRRC